VACPYFIPTEPHERELWPHRYRLSLGDGFAGRCGAQAAETCCDDETLRSHCNMGYANLEYAECAHLPAERAFDAVRFQVRRQGSTSGLTKQDSTILLVQFACEREHRPALSGELRYDASSKTWLDRPDARLLSLAEAAVMAWMRRHDDGRRESIKLQRIELCQRQ
jgi:hypothetical protein